VPPRSEEKKEERSSLTTQKKGIFLQLMQPMKKGRKVEKNRKPWERGIERDDPETLI